MSTNYFASHYYSPEQHIEGTRSTWNSNSILGTIWPNRRHDGTHRE